MSRDSYPEIGYVVSCYAAPTPPPEGFSVRIPKTVSEALGNPSWKAAMETEMRSLEKNSVLKYVHLPRGKRPIGCKWVFAVKYNDDGSVARYKARLVATGVTQTPPPPPGTLNYGAPVAQMPSIRLVISLATHYNWFLHHLDVQNAYSHVGLNEEIYMSNAPGFQLQREHSGKVCRLLKTVCGFKQSQNAWFQRFSSVIISMEFSRCYSDPTCFYRRGRGGLRTIVVVNVDDVIITGDDKLFIETMRKHLAQFFEITYLGHLRRFAGIELTRKGEHGISLSQRRYILDLLTDTGMLDCQPSDTPMDPDHRLHANVGTPLQDPSNYRSLVGRLLYLTNARPDIAYAVNVLTQFTHSPRTPHLEAVYKVLRYLNSCPLGLGLVYTAKSTAVVLSCYAKAEFASSPHERAPSGYCTFLDDHLISWKSQKQDEVSHSFTEAEYTAIADGTCEILWLRNFLTELGFAPQTSSPLHCDKNAAVMITSNCAVHERTEQLEVDIHFLREKVESRAIDIVPVQPTEQIAAMFTKPLIPTALRPRIDKLGMGDLSSVTRSRTIWS